METKWVVRETRATAKALLKLPIKIQRIYRQLVFDLTDEGPNPYGWDCLPLKGGGGIRIRMNREYRAVIQIEKPFILVVRVAHRKEVYE